MKVKMLLVFMLLAFGSLISDCKCTERPKIYISPYQVDFLDGKIFVKMGEEIFEVFGLFTDESGLYFQSASKSKKCGFLETRCPICDRCKPKWKHVCPFCNNEPS